MPFQKRNVDNPQGAKTSVTTLDRNTADVVTAYLPLLLNNVEGDIQISEILALVEAATLGDLPFNIISIRDGEPSLPTPDSDDAAKWLRTIGISNDGVMKTVKEVISNPAHAAQGNWEIYTNLNFDGSFLGIPATLRWIDGHFFYNLSNHTWYRFVLNNVTSNVDIQVVADPTDLLGSDSVWLGNYAYPAAATAAISSFDSNKKYYAEFVSNIYELNNDTYVAASSSITELQWIPSTQTLTAFIREYLRDKALAQTSRESLERKTADLHEVTKEIWTTITDNRLIGYLEGSSVADDLYSGTVPGTTQWHNKLELSSHPYNVVVRLLINEDPADFRLWVEETTGEKQRSIRLDSWTQYAVGATYKYYADPSRSLDSGSFVLQYHGSEIHTELDAPITERGVRASGLELKENIDHRFNNIPSIRSGDVLPAHLEEHDLFRLLSASETSKKTYQFNGDSAIYNQSDGYFEYWGYNTRNFGPKLPAIGSGGPDLFRDNRLIALLQTQSERSDTNQKIKVIVRTGLFNAASLTAEETTLILYVPGYGDRFFSLQASTFDDTSGATRTVSGQSYSIYETTVPPPTDMLELSIENDNMISVQITQLVSGVRQFLSDSLTNAWIVGDTHTAGLFSGDTNQRPYEVEINPKGELDKVKSLIPTKHQSLTSASTITWNIDDGVVADLTLGHNVTLTLSGGENGDTAMLRVLQDTTGSRILTLASAIQRGGRDAPVLNTSPNKRDFILFTNISGTWYYLGIIADA